MISIFHKILICSVLFVSFACADEQFLAQGADEYQLSWCGLCKITDEGANKGGRTLANYRGDDWAAALDNCAAKGGTLWPALYPCNI